MTDELKYIVTQINNTLNTEYNLISFDSMSGEGLLQVLVDILVHFNATTKFDVKFNDREDTVRRILEGLQRIQYRPHIEISDPTSFRRSVHHGDKKVIHPILRYIFDHKEKIHQLTYLARFLLPISLPPEAMANPEIANLWNEYLLIQEEFKQAHKGHIESSKETSHLKELRNDINAIEMEKANVKKRIERTQARLDKVPQQELVLEAAHALRLERDRQKELEAQLEDQKHNLHRAQTMQERLQKELSNARMAAQGTSAQQMMETIQEETQVMEFMVKQKLPNEMRNMQEEIKLLEEVIDEPNVSKDYLNDLQMKVDSTSRKIQQFVEKRLSERGDHNDSLVPFRQQAALIARNKEMAAEQLNQANKELREVETILMHKQKLLKDTVGEIVLRGEDLKQYVNTLRAKSSVYKQQRSELASIRAEVADLTQTLENLKAQDPTLSSTLPQVTEEDSASLDGSISRPDSPLESRGLTELSRLVEGLVRAVQTARSRVMPISQKMRPLREHIDELKDERDSKKNAYLTLSATLDSEAKVLENENLETEKSIKELESEWNHLKLEYERAENLLERVRDEMNNRRPEGEIPVKESLQNQIREQENKLKDLQLEQEELFENQDQRLEQQKLWEDVKQLMEVKIQCMQEAKAKGLGGTFSIAKNSETFTLH
ncbi:unnamed protein product [Hermetia illucens]|uniref:IFT81 calponin homology domain-containing protein n=1 Tax=Hermetia illucens TaxID=343691 RepID=A0A7R8UPK5_HERIL|nr:intraflagellar transport protein 81 homolog [Hermetia illucens]CAD7084672.1 unnamed protein product [Hermetia illucens]